MKFRIEQVAIAPLNPEAAIELLTAMGAGAWARDHVCAAGMVFGKHGSNEADLAFNYDLRRAEVKPLEFEVLSYTDGPNWITGAGRINSVSHIGMHCTAEELADWREFFLLRGISVAQEVMTQSHTNPNIAGQRWYNYVIFNTKGILGVDVKFIVRRDEPGEMV